MVQFQNVISKASQQYRRIKAHRYTFLLRDELNLNIRNLNLKNIFLLPIRERPLALKKKVQERHSYSMFIEQGKAKDYKYIYEVYIFVILQKTPECDHQKKENDSDTSIHTRSPDRLRSPCWAQSLCRIENTERGWLLIAASRPRRISPHII